MRTAIELAWGDGTYLFRLPLPLLIELQNKTGLGVGELYAKLLRGRYLIPQKDGSAVPVGDPSQGAFAVLDVLEPIRLGLIGGNKGLVNGQDVQVSAIRASELMEAYAYPAAPLKDAWDTAVAILSVAVEGWNDPSDLKKKEDRNGELPLTDAPAGSTTAKSSPTAPSRARPRSKRGN